MGDLISRTDALDAVQNYFKSKLDNISGDRETAIETILDDNAEICAKILAVPSVEAIPLDGAYIKQIRWERDIALQQLAEIGCGLGRDMTDIKAKLEEPPVVHGEWIHVESSDMATGRAYKCSNCKKMRYGSFMPPYCQICGAKMDGKATK
ncbi:MAG: hypothetical protein IKW37_01390 [Bacteroidaceae bacterium]|nr:hypothetical protein [Bacteroidaceae bacterium]